MFDSGYIISLLFPDVIESAILIDGVVHIPFEVAVGSMGSVIVVYGLLLGAAAFFIWQLLGLFKTILELGWLLIKRKIQKKHAAPEDIPPTEVL